MTAQSLAPQNKSKRKSRTRFQRLWSDSVELARENTQLETDLDLIVRRVESEVLKAERDLGETMLSALYRQLDFAQKKSLLQWQRGELALWIEEHLFYLLRLGMVDEPLRNKLAEVQAFELGITLDPDSKLSATEQVDQYIEAEEAKWTEEDSQVAARDETVADLFADEEAFEHEDFLLDEGVLGELFESLSEDGAGPHPGSSTATPAPDDKPVDDALFKRIFRQTAAALHPDKESNEKLRAEKHELMTELLKARKDFDLITMLRLHEQYANADSELSVDDQKALEAVLVQYLKQQELRLEEIVHQSPVHHFAYQKFYSKKSATVTRRIKAHIKELESQRQGLCDFVDEVKTLKKLKELLKQRYDSVSYKDLWF